MQEGFSGNGLSHGGGRVGGVGKGGRSGRGGKHSEKGKLGPPIDKHWAEKWRKNLKIAGVCVLTLHPNLAFDNNLTAPIQSSD